MSTQLQRQVLHEQNCDGPSSARNACKLYQAASSRLRSPAIRAVCKVQYQQKHTSSSCMPKHLLDTLKSSKWICKQAAIKGGSIYR